MGLLVKYNRMIENNIQNTSILVELMFK